MKSYWKADASRARTYHNDATVRIRTNNIRPKLRFTSKKKKREITPRGVLKTRNKNCAQAQAVLLDDAWVDEDGASGRYWRMMMHGRVYYALATWAELYSLYPFPLLSEHLQICDPFINARVYGGVLKTWCRSHFIVPCCLYSAGSSNFVCLTVCTVF